MFVWLAILFMFIGGAVVELFEIHAWKRYQQGKHEGRTGWQDYGYRP